MEAGELISMMITIPIVVFIFYILIKQFCKIEPGFCTIGYSLLGALVIGVIFFLKFGWQRR